VKFNLVAYVIEVDVIVTTWHSAML